MKHDKRGTWPQALGSLFGAILLILAIRWAFFEPYVIPSGSMIPTLLIHDHILVNKFSYGLRLPFTSHWLVRFGQPERGDVIVFKSLEDEGIFLVKRVVGLPGDTVVVAPNGEMTVNGHPIPRKPLSREEAASHLNDWPVIDREALVEEFEFSLETLDDHSHLVIHEREQFEGPDSEPNQYRVPEHSLFMMGDNRDNSSDSRVWGPLPIDKVLGRATTIWLSCEETLPEANQLCDPKTMRWNRLFKGIQ